MYVTDTGDPMVVTVIDRIGNAYSGYASRDHKTGDIHVFRDAYTRNGMLTGRSRIAIVRDPGSIILDSTRKIGVEEKA